MKYAEEMYLDSQIFAGDMDGSESNFTEKIVKVRKPHTCCVCEKKIPKGTKVANYGYYSVSNGCKWLYVQFTYKNVTYTGFASSTYLRK